MHVIGCNINIIPYSGESIGNLVIPEDKQCISELGWSFILSRTDIKFRFCDKIIDVNLTRYELISFLLKNDTQPINSREITTVRFSPIVTSVPQRVQPHW